MARYLNLLLVTAGLGIAGYGAYLAWPPLAFIATGAAMFWMGLPD